VLKIRVITALFIAAVTFAVIFLTTAWGFRLSMAVLWLIGIWEFARLAGLGPRTRWLLFLIQAALVGLMMRYWSGIAGHGQAFLVAACLSWCVMFLRLISFKSGDQPGLNYRLLSFFSALASISFAWYALGWLREQPRGEYLVLLLVFIIWAADTGAYFAGRHFGRNRLAPVISPGKTREGLFGGAVLAVPIALLFTHLTLGLPSTPGWLLLVTVVTVFAAAASDLFISVHKRTVGLKDTGRLLPGHGGVLDRFDSLLAGAPFFALGIQLLEM
jgi:phosphatidate cytidylyltransferase